MSGSRSTLPAASLARVVVFAAFIAVLGLFPGIGGVAAVTVVEPRLSLERRLLKEFPILVACDEVGRGALAGPVAVGAVAIVVATAFISATLFAERLRELAVAGAVEFTGGRYPLLGPPGLVPAEPQDRGRAGGRRPQG